MPILLNNQKTISGNSQNVDLDIRDVHYASVTIVGAMSATVSFFVSNDQTTWFPIALTPAAGGAAVTTATAAGAWSANVQPWAYLRAGTTAYTSGSPVVTTFGLEVAGF